MWGYPHDYGNPHLDLLKIRMWFHNSGYPSGHHQSYDPAASEILHGTQKLGAFQ